MTVPGHTRLRARLRPAFAAFIAGAAMLPGAVLVLAPAALTRGVWPPLHARCIGVMLVSLAVALASAQRALDPAALRMPLVVVAGWALSSAVPALAGSGAPWAWALVGAGGAGLLFARIDSDPPAPAQHPDRAWLAVALLALLAGLGLLAAASHAATHWPWRLSAAQVAQYGPLFLAWGLGAWMVSRERRRYVRAPVLWGLLAWCGGVLSVSAWHVGAFRWSQPLAWFWFAGFAALGLLSAQRLWPAWRPRWLRVLGLESHDSGTTRPRQ
jgi:hypothetical protein